MSLLLDALQRAGKEKKGEATTAHAEKPDNQIAAHSKLELEPTPPATVPIDSETPDSDRVISHATPETSPPLTLEEPIVTTPKSAPPTPLPERRSDTSPPPSPSPSAATHKPTVTTIASHASPQIAQDIRAAGTPSRGESSKQKRSVQHRIWMLGAVALVLLLGAGGTFLALLEQTPNLTEDTGPSAQAPAPPTIPEEQTGVKTPPAIASSLPSPQPSHRVEEAAGSSPDALKTTDPPISTHRLPSHPKLVEPVRDRHDHMMTIHKQQDTQHILNEAYAALLADRLDDAAIGYRQALNHRPEERDALLGLAYIAHRRGRPDEARLLYQSVLRQAPENLTASAGLLALQSAGESANPNETESHARALTEKHPESAAAFSTLGNTLVRQGRLADAQQAFFRALALDSSNGLHAYNLAVALDRLHKYDLARNYYERAMTLIEKNARHDIPLQSIRDRLDQLRIHNPVDAPDTP